MARPTSAYPPTCAPSGQRLRRQLSSLSLLPAPLFIASLPPLTEERWERIAPLLPPQRPPTGRPATNHRQILEGMLWVMQAGTSWRQMPPPLWAVAHHLWPLSALDARGTLGADSRGPALIFITVAVVLEPVSRPYTPPSRREERRAGSLATSLACLSPLHSCAVPCMCAARPPSRTSVMFCGSTRQSPAPVPCARVPCWNPPP